MGRRRGIVLRHACARVCGRAVAIADALLTRNSAGQSLDCCCKSSALFLVCYSLARLALLGAAHAAYAYAPSVRSELDTSLYRHSTAADFGAALALVDEKAIRVITIASVEEQQKLRETGGALTGHASDRLGWSPEPPDNIKRLHAAGYTKRDARRGASRRDNIKRLHARYSWPAWASPKAWTSCASG